jgi:hypothetical protein
MTKALSPYKRIENSDFEAYWRYKLFSDDVIAAVWRYKSGTRSDQYYCSINEKNGRILSPNREEDNIVATATSVEEGMLILDKILIENGYELVSQERMGRLELLR